MRLKYQFSLISILVISNGCKKAVEVSPPITGLVSTTVFSSNTTAAAAVTSIYDNMMGTGTFSDGTYSVGYLSGLLADELENYSSDVILSQCYTNALTSQQGYFWDEIYQEIYVANAAIEGLGNSTGVNTTLKQQLTGEAEFMRAFFHFYAVNLYGDVPLVTTTNYLTNNVISRSPQAKVYQQIIVDLKDAQSLLSDNFMTPLGAITTERVRPNKGAATALLARTYLYTGDWVDAETQASLVINNTANYSLDTNLNQVFLMNSTEAIWQLQPVQVGYNTFDAVYFVLTSPPAVSGQFSVSLATNVLSAFEPGDSRDSNWVGTYNSGSQTYYYPYKYKANTYSPTTPLTEYLMVLRLAEQYLIRAEARAQQGNIAGAIGDLNIIRGRAHLAGLSMSLSQSQVLKAVAHERQVELFTEWGHRWFDLKRTGAVDSVMNVVTPQKNGIWNNTDTLFPIPQSEVLLNPNLVQNQGYN